MSAAGMELLERLRRHATDAADRAAVREVSGGHVTTYRQLHDEVERLAATLRADYSPGSVLLLRCPNVARYHVAFLGALAAGVTIFPVSPDIAPGEFDTATEKAGAVASIDDNLRVHRLDARGRHDPAAPHGPALLLQSSGTTGLPKIARRDGRSLDAVASNMVDALGLEPSDQVLSCVPLCHSYGLEHGLLAPIWAGATVHLAQGFDIGVIRRELSGPGITAFPAVPSIYEMLANVSDANGGGAMPSLRLAYSAGATLPACLFAKLLDQHRLSVGQLYGATEIGSVTFAHPARPNFEPASVGRAMAGVELRVDADGHLAVRAPSMMSGYVGGDPSPLTADGFFPTGDLARLDDHGNLFITGRLKLLIDVGGLKVNPIEVEQTICDHPAVAACVVVPIRLSETVSRLKALVTPADASRPPSAEELRRFVRGRISSHKVPRVFEVRESLPRSATGKILRHLLVETS